MGKMVAWFAGNHVAANILMLLMLIAGVVSALGMKLEIFPETTTDKVIISVTYRGASPQEVEEAVVARIEEKIAGVAGINRIDSLAMEGLGRIAVEVIDGWDLDRLLDDVKSAVDRMTTLPEEADKPRIYAEVHRSQVLNLAVWGDVPEGSLKYWAQQIRDEITSLPGVTQADISGMRDSEISIEISEADLRRFNLTLEQVAQKIRLGNLDLPAGSIKSAHGEILVRTKGKRYHASQFAAVTIISTGRGATVTLGDLGRVREGFQDVDLEARFQGRPAVMINVFRVARQNAIDVAAKVKAYAESIRQRLPAGVNLTVYADRSEIIKSRLQLLLKNMAFGLVLVALLLGIFLSPRLAFWVTLGIPASFAAALALLPSFDVSLNMISLFAFIMVLGIVVDDAIIVGENVYRHSSRGLSGLEAAVTGTVQVGRPVVFSVLTTMVAFWPLLMGSGIMGKFMRNIPVVVILVLAASLVESLFVLPAHLARSRALRDRDSGGERKARLPARVLERFVNGPYRRALEVCLNWRYLVIAAALAILMVTWGVWKAGLIRFTFFPKVEGDTLRCLVVMPAGTPKQRTGQVLGRIEEAARRVLADLDRRRGPGKQPLLRYSMTLIGAHLGRGGRAFDRGGHLGQVWIQLIPAQQRQVGAAEITRLWRRQVGTVAGAEAVTFSSVLHSMGRAIEVNLSAEDQHLLLKAVRRLKKELGRYPGVSDIDDSFQPGKTELCLKLRPGAEALGLTLADLARQVRAGLYGAEALRFQRGRNEVKVMVRYPAAERYSRFMLENIRIRTASGHQVPFSAVARVETRQGYAVIERSQRRQVVTVAADVDENLANAEQIRNELEQKLLPEMMDDYPGLRFSMEGEGRRKTESMADIMKGFIVALFGIYALLAIPFRSFSQPLVVMAAIPFGVVGAMAGHLLMGMNLSIMSFFGLVGLSGVVVNDALVLVHRANALVRRGSDPCQAVARAGVLRFRAILLTSITTFAGLTPMLLERSVQARFLIPMAISLGFGVMFATLITLLLIPCGYLVLNDLLHLFGKQVVPPEPH